jgi:hypothetical protein
MLPRFNVRIFAVLLLSTLAICLVEVGPANSADKPEPWVAKDWTKWTSDDCTQVEYYSPWSHNVSSYVVGRYGDVTTSVELRSALPVRQARLRDEQIKKRYDKMDAENKHEFDQQNASLSGDAGDKVEIVITNVSDRPPRNANAESGVFAPAQAVQAVLSLVNGTHVQPIEIKILPPSSGIDVFSNETEYVFPRVVNGKPLFSPNDSLIVISLGDPLIVDKKTGKVEDHDFRGSGMALSFKISDLMYKGKLEY